MKSSLLKIIKITFVMSIVIPALMLVLGAYACSQLLPKYKEKEVGNFVVRFYNDSTVAYITGLSELGQQQKNIVIPKEIDGVKVYVIGEKALLNIFGGVGMVELHSDKLEKIFFTASVSIMSGTFKHCPNLRKAISITGKYISGLEGFTRLYYSNDIYLSKNNHARSNVCRANVSYYYNYANAENDGYYWLDDYDYGSRIEYVPEEPTREGYTFGGWYKEAECINKWNFNSDTLPEEKTEINEDGKEEVIYQETKLYAKWM